MSSDLIYYKQIQLCLLSINGINEIYIFVEDESTIFLIRLYFILQSNCSVTFQEYMEVCRTDEEEGASYNDASIK